MKYIGIEEEISSIIRAVERSEMAVPVDFIKYLNELNTTRFFVRYAQSAAWLVWCEENGLLARVMNKEGQLTEPDKLLCEWIARHFVADHFEELHQLFANHRMQMSEELWNSIAWQLANGANRPHGRPLAAWTAILLTDVPQSAYLSHRLEYLLVNCEWPKDNISVLQLFSHLLQPVTKFETSAGYLFNKSPYKFEYTSDLRGDDYWLREVWKGTEEKLSLSSRIQDFWQDLLPLVHKYLLDAHKINLSFGKADGDYDAQSFWRSAIEPHAQDRNSHRAFDVLIDVARDLLVFLLNRKNLNRLGKETVEVWYASQAPLLRRIAIHAVTFGKYGSPDQRVLWLLKKKIIHSVDFKHEVFMLIRHHLAGCSDTVVTKCIVAAMRGIKKASADQTTQESIQYEILNLLNWMAESAPHSHKIKNAFDLFSAGALIKPFKRREYPDLTHWISSGEETDGVADAKRSEIPQLRDMTVEEAVHNLIHFNSVGDRPWKEPRRTLLESFTAAVTEDINWSLEIANALSTANLLSTDVWDSLIEGWRQANLDTEVWTNVIRILSNHRELHEQSRSSSRLLENVLERGTKLSFDVLKDLEGLSDFIWGSIADLQTPIDTDNGWLTAAANHAAGNLAGFWTYALDQRFRIHEKERKGLPEEYKTRLSWVITSNTLPAQLATCVLAGRLEHFSFWDRDWTREFLLPKFDYSQDRTRANQVWDGYLHWSNLPLNLRQEFKPLLRQAIGQIEVKDKELHERLFSSIADIMVVETSASPNVSWILDIVANDSTTDEGRKWIAERWQRTLRETSVELAERMWQEWMKEVWGARAANKPVPLSAMEADQYFESVPYLGQAFASAVATCLQMQKADLTYTFLFSELLERGFCKTEPKNVVEFVTHLLKMKSQYGNHQMDLVPLYMALKSELQEEEILPLKEELVRLGFVSALE